MNSIDSLVVVLIGTGEFCLPSSVLASHWPPASAGQLNQVQVFVALRPKNRTENVQNSLLLVCIHDVLDVQVVNFQLNPPPRNA